MKILAAGMEWVDQMPGGLNQYFADYLEAMARSGHSVMGLVSGEGSRLEAPSYIRDVLPRNEKPRLNTYSRIVSFQRSVKERTEEFRPDLFNPHFALYASLVTRNSLPSQIPIVTHFHGPWSYESQVEEQGSSLANLLRHRIKKRIERTTYRRSDAFVVLSRYFQRFLADRYGIPEELIHIVPGAVDTERFRPSEDREALRQRLGLSEDAQVLFCARRLVRRMGIDNLIQAMESVKAEAPNAVLFVAGAGPLRDELQQRIEKLGLQSAVHLLGRVSSEELVEWYQAADLSVVPTLTLEGFGLVTTEALACGTPVLGTPYGGTEEILSNLSDELLFRDHSPEAMADKLIRALRGECPIPSRSECRRHVLERYTWDRVSVLLTQVYKNAIEARRKR